MLVVNTTSATAGRKAESEAPENRPRKRVPSSRRRNPGSVTRDAANLLLRGRSWRFRRRRTSGGRGRGNRLQRNSGGRRWRWRRVLLRTEALLEHRARYSRVRRHQLQDEAE